MQELFVETGCSEEDELLDDEENDEDGWPAVQACLEPHDIDSVLNEDMNWLAGLGPSSDPKVSFESKGFVPFSVRSKGRLLET